MLGFKGCIPGLEYKSRELEVALLNLAAQS